MLRHGSLAASLFVMAKNGVLSLVETNMACEQLVRLQPQLASKAKCVTTLVLQLSRGVRTLLSWFRDYKKGKGKRQLLKGASAKDEAFLDSIVENLVLINAKDLEVPTSKDRFYDQTVLQVGFIIKMDSKLQPCVPLFPGQKLICLSKWILPV